jgi:hypothetical protein
MATPTLLAQHRYGACNYTHVDSNDYRDKSRIGRGYLDP